MSNYTCTSTSETFHASFLPFNSLNSIIGLALPLDLVRPFPFVIATSNLLKFARFLWKPRSKLFYEAMSNANVESLG
jgi:hypothetical protein